MKFLGLSVALVKNLVRQKSIIFSSFLLPLVLIWATWWVTADFPMFFDLALGGSITAGMVDVHIFTGGLTAMGITSGLFGFMIIAESNNISHRLKVMGYKDSTIILSSFVVLFSLLVVTATVSILFSSLLASPKSWGGIILAIFGITLIYSAIGGFLATVYPNMTAGSLTILIFSFLDLMLITNPMGEEFYLQSWTYMMPGFWPVQLALESGFIGFPKKLDEAIFYILAYFFGMIILTILAKRYGFTREVS
jgi:hypothetical protein